MSLLVASVFAGPVFNATALTWTGLSTVTNDWSDPNNWSPANAPTASDVVVFTNAGSTNVLGAVNNAVNSSVTISNLSYNPISNNVSVNFHTTLINTGATLTVDSTINATNASVLFVGADNVGANDQIYATITGAGTLAIGNLASPDTNMDIVVGARVSTANSGGHKATLDMSGLNKFTFGGGRFQVTANGISAALAGAQYVGVDRPWGSVLLAKTNVITAARPRADAFPFSVAPFAICDNRYANGTANPTLLELGQENTINAEAIIVAGARAGNAVATATMKFRSGLTNPTLKLRNSDGISRIADIGIGDNDIPNSATVQSIGVMDLSLGTVDAMVDTLNVGRGNGYLGTQAANGTGTLTLGAGTWDVTTLNIGCQIANNLCKSTGTVNVRTNATLIAGNINIGRDAGDNTTGFGTGTLTLLGGSAKVSGNIVENDATGGVNGVSTLTINNGGTMDMMPPGDTVPGNITVDRLNFGIGTLTNYGTLSLSTLVVTSPQTVFTVYSGQALAPVAKGVVGMLAVTGGLTLAGGTVDFDLNTPGVNDLITVSTTLTLSGVNSVDLSAAGGTIATGTYTLMTYGGALVGDTNNLQMTGALANSRYSFLFDTDSVPNVNLTVAGSISNLTWSGDGAVNVWNLKTATNWNSQTETFYDLDNVTFDDSSTNPVVTLAGTLEPGSVTVASASNYTFTGSGKLSGSSGLALNGSGTLTLGTANDFVGPVNVNAGTLLVNGALGNATVTVASGAILGGTGTILGPVTVQSGGTFSPGASIGTLAVSNNLVLADGSTTVFEANMTTLAQDNVIGLNSVTYGGTLSLALSGRPVAVSDKFKLFSATTVAVPTWLYSPYSGAFSSIVPATPGADLAWNTYTLATDGTLRVVSTAPTSMTLQQTGNQFTLSWPPDHVGWRLERQINPITVGISNNWTDVSGSTTTSNVTVTINPANGSVFYRLVYP
jgi:autotransporter-associated beta strand protein